MIGETIIKHLELIGCLSNEDREALRDIRGECRKLKRGEDILDSGQRPGYAVVVVEGMLQCYTLSPDGNRQIHSFYIPSDTPCMETLHIGVMNKSLGAVAPSLIATVPHSELHRVMDAHPQVLSLIWRETLVQGAIFREWLMRNSRMLAHARMAHFFCEIMIRARAAGLAWENSCDLPITQEDLADALGMSIVHVNRTLMAMRTGGLLEFKGGVLSVPDWNQLAEVGEFDPAYLHLRA